MNKYLLSSGVLLLLATSLQSCRDDKDYYDPDLTQKWIEESFDFKTTTDLNVTFNTGTKKLVRIYNANPQETPAAKEIYAAFTDDNGNYNGSATISSIYNGKTLYALVDGQVYEVKATSNGLQLSTATNRAASRADNVDYAKLADNIKTAFVDKLEEYENNTQVIIDMGGEMQYWDDRNKNNKEYFGTNVDIITTEETTLKVMFSHSGAGTGNTFKLYYYYHPKNINTHAEYNMPGGMYYDKYEGEGWEKMYQRIDEHNDKLLLWEGFNNGNFSNIAGEVKKLYYYGDNFDGTPQETFPANYQIGFVLVWNTGNSAGDGARQRAKFTTAWANWSTWIGGGKNDYTPAPQATRFRYGENILVYGFEDIGYNYIKLDGSNDAGACDRDFNDCIFAVITNKKIEGNNGEIPDIKPEEPEEHTSTFNGLLLFEDLFPSQGDYDMNDVVVEYQYAVTFDTNNIVKKIEATYTPRWDGADYSSAFGIQLENKAKDILSNQTIFRDHKFTQTGKPITGEITGQQFTVDITPTSEVSKDDLVFNPYITVSTGYEVHLTKMQPTASFATNQLYQKLNDAEKAYVTVGSKFPYALDIFEATWNDFEIVTERTRIDSEYTDFTKWVDKNASEYTDWWKN